MMSSNLSSNSKTDKNIGRFMLYLKILMYCLLFFLSLSLLRNPNISNDIKGVISQFQMMISIYMVLSCKKIGYSLILMMNFVLITIIAIVVTSGNITALPGDITALNTILIASLIYRYYTKLNNKIVEVSENEKVLSEQNLKLFEYNKIMKNNESRLDYLANYDYLTNLPNRKMIINRIQLLIDNDKEIKKTFAVVFIDIDNFKNINDTMGHEVGDLLLIAVSEKLKNLVHTADMVARLGGDEFALIIEDFKDEEATYTYLKNIKETLSKTIEIKSFRYKINASYGVSIYPKNGENAIELLKNADTAMYTAKAIGKNSITFFTSEMREEILNRVSIENNLKQA